MKNQLIHNLLVKTYIILPYKIGDTDAHKFNLYNPLGWIVLLIVSLAIGLFTGFYSFGRYIWDAVTTR